MPPEHMPPTTGSVCVLPRLFSVLCAVAVFMVRGFLAAEQGVAAVSEEQVGRVTGMLVSWRLTAEPSLLTLRPGSS